jgi:hypothetical protein
MGRSPNRRTCRRRIEVEPGLFYDTCDPEPTNPKTAQALAEMVRAAARMARKELEHDDER